MNNDRFYKSIVFKLIISVVIIFISMMAITNYMINQKQIQMTEDLLLEVERWIPSYKNSVIVTVNNAHIQSTADFRIYTLVVTGMVLIIGSLIFALIISKILSPLRDLQKNIAKIDIDKPETFENSFLVEDGSSEIVDLANSFNALMDRIYRDYKRQKDFSANVAHELRTPVAVMRAQVDVFKRKNTDKNAEIFASKIDKSLDKLKNLIESVLMFSSKQTTSITEVNIASLIEEILFDLEDKIRSKNLTVSIKAADDIKLMTDDALLQRLVFNIIENAIKYNNLDGFIDISVASLKDKLIIEVADGGIGMSAEEKKKIFDIFYQVDDSRSAEGFGIGLALSKQLADTLGARIEVYDNEPVGSRFLIIFDLVK